MIPFQLYSIALMIISAGLIFSLVLAHDDRINTPAYQRCLKIAQVVVIIMTAFSPILPFGDMINLFDYG